MSKIYFPNELNEGIGHFIDRIGRFPGGGDITPTVQKGIGIDRLDSHGCSLLSGHDAKDVAQTTVSANLWFSSESPLLIEPGFAVLERAKIITPEVVLKIMAELRAKLSNNLGLEFERVVVEDAFVDSLGYGVRKLKPGFSIKAESDHKNYSIVSDRDLFLREYFLNSPDATQKQIRVVSAAILNAVIVRIESELAQVRGR